MRKLIAVSKENSIIFAVFQNDELEELKVVSKERLQAVQIGDIYAGIVRKIIANTAFLEIENGILAYYDFSESANQIFLKKYGKKVLSEGDVLVVQVVKEAVKTKKAAVTSYLTLQQEDIFLTTKNRSLGISKKLDSESKERLKEWVEPYLSEEYGFLVRTSAKECSKEKIEEEITKLSQTYKQITECQSKYGKIKGMHPYLSVLKESISKGITEVITDDTVLYEMLAAHFKEQIPDIRYWKETVSLASIYRIDTAISNLLKSKVWLKSGASIIISQTEAMTVIDVNLGKCNIKESQEALFFKINQEAAKEIARQLKLRNISGIVIIDFLKHKEVAYIQKLEDYMKEQTASDTIQTEVIDTTKLQLMELTRKQEGKTLYAALKECESFGEKRE